MANLNRNVATPSLIDVLHEHKRDILLSLNCHAIAQITAFDADNQTVTATVNYKKTIVSYSDKDKPSYNIVNYPILMDCPVIIIGGKDACLTMPISSGDNCLILFNDRDIDKWFQGGQVTDLATNRLHNFSDGIALVGLNSLATSITDYDITRATLRNGVAGVGVSTAKVKIFNVSDSLGPLLQNLITEIQTLVTQTGLLITATQAITVNTILPGPVIPVTPTTYPSAPGSIPTASFTPITTSLGTLATNISATAVQLAALLE